MIREIGKCFLLLGVLLATERVGILYAQSEAAREGTARSDSPRLDFGREVRPILADKCFRCHGPDPKSRESGLRLDEREAALAPADSGRAAIVPGQPDASELVRRITAEDADERMPPLDSKQSLSQDEKRRLIEWIRQGADYDVHWSLRPIVRPPVPSVKDAAWAANPIDSFILARLERDQRSPSPPADTYRLVRRVYLDLTGLPPSPEEADRFAADERPEAYERLVDRLLASPAFGERMAWDWLDAARYADSNGYQGDADRTMWPWRDWVVSAFNRNLPLDDFTVWQIAGDLLPDATEQQRLATGFCRNHMINGEGGRIAEENRVDYVMDMTETMGTVWLGLTLNCCRCHDHKFDPLTRADYYSLFAFFNQTPIDGAGGNPQTPPVLEQPSPEQKVLREEARQALRSSAERVRELEQSLQPTDPPDEEILPDEIAKILKQKLESRKNEELDKLDKHFGESQAAYVEALRAYRAAKKRRDDIEQSIPRVMIMHDLAEPRETFMLEKGLYNQPGERVAPRVPASLPALHVEHRPNRLDLARWLVSDDQPLVARVLVNRIWQQLFGIGLVKTSEDFGTQGEPPSHPELLDWLACELRDSGWDLKHICRLIVTSATYRQSSRVTRDVYEYDPENRLLARGARYRLPAWMIRDQALAVSGLLVPRLGGPPVYPYQPEGVWEEATFGKKSYPQDHGEKLYRRSLYTFWRRIVGPTMFFDTASRQICSVKQSRTNTPLHALTTLNDTTYVEAARVLAQRIYNRRGADALPADLVTDVFRHVLVRPPSVEERDILTKRLVRLEEEFAADEELAKQFVANGEYPWDAGVPVAKLAALGALANAVMNLDEALTKE